MSLGTLITRVSIFIVSWSFLAYGQFSGSPSGLFFQKKPTLTGCSGTLVGGFCWHLGAIGDSCTTVCAPRGGYDEATRTYAGSDGSLANCDSVLEALGAPAVSGSGLLADTTGSAGGIGCHSFYSTLLGGFYSRYRDIGATTAGGVYSGPTPTPDIRRACACNN